jgi:periplasmic protein CpxP/Spy
MNTIPSFGIFAALFFSLTVLLSNPVSAQREGRGKQHQHGEHQIENLKTELNLSEEQMKTVREAAQVRNQKMKAAREKKQENNEEVRNEMKQARSEFQDKVNSVLTPEQKAKWEEMKKEHKSPEERAKKRSQKYKTDLGLDEAQTQKMEAALVQKYAARQAAQEADDKAAMKKAKQDYDAQVKQILSPEQYKKYEEMKEEKKQGKGQGKGHQKGKGGRR